MASKFGVVVDSTCDLPPDWPYHQRVHVIPEHIRFDDKDYREGIDITPTEFFQKVLY